MADTVRMFIAKKQARRAGGVAGAYAASSGIDGAGDHHEERVGGEPGDGRPRPVKQQEGQRREERPQDDAARGDEPSPARVHEERQREDEQRLAEAEPGERLCPGEVDEAQDSANHVAERDRRRAASPAAP